MDSAEAMEGQATSFHGGCRRRRSLPGLPHLRRLPTLHGQLLRHPRPRDRQVAKRAPVPLEGRNKEQLVRVGLPQFGQAPRGQVPIPRVPEVDRVDHKGHRPANRVVYTQDTLMARQSMRVTSRVDFREPPSLVPQNPGRLVIRRREWSTVRFSTTLSTTESIRPGSTTPQVTQFAMSIGQIRPILTEVHGLDIRVRRTNTAGFRMTPRLGPSPACGV